MLGLLEWNALQSSGSATPDDTADVTPTNIAMTLVLTETTTHTVTTTSLTPAGPATRSETTSPSTETPGSTANVIESDDSHIDDRVASESYDAIEWHPGGRLNIENGAVLELSESET